jgi:hypothetical protein
MFLLMTNRTTPKSRPAKSVSAIERSVIERDLLIALFRLSRDTLHISAKTLADEVSGTPTQIGAALVRLEQEGVVDATRARLTMKGLVLATQLGAGSGGLRIAHRKAQPKAKAAPAGIEDYEDRQDREDREQNVPVAALPSQRPPAPASSPRDEQRVRYEQPQALLIGLHS